MEAFYTFLGYFLCIGFGAAVGGAVGLFVGLSGVEDGDAMVMGAAAAGYGGLGGLIGGGIGFMIARSGRSESREEDEQ
jgi:hypothetical protein